MIPAPPSARRHRARHAGGRRDARRRSNGGGLHVTRLHARYGKDTLGDNLYFRPAGAITGGRESQGTQAQPSSQNDFQARYVIRHKWTGPVTCASPRFGTGAGHPTRDPGTTPAMNLAFAARDVDVAALVKSPLPPGLELSKGTPAGPPRIPPSGGCAGCATAPGGLDWATGAVGVMVFYGMTRRARKQGAKR